MASVEEHLRRWREADVLDAEAAERIRAFEGAAPGRDERPGVMEALVYLGIAIVTVGVVILIGSNWDELETWARVASPAIPGALAVAAGAVLRRMEEAGLRRGGQVAWLAGATLIALTMTAIGAEAHWDEGDVAIASGLVATAVAVALWVVEPSHPQVVGVAAALLVLGLALGSTADEEYSSRLGGVCTALFGAAGLILTELGYLKPRVSAQLLAAAGIAFGVFFANTGETERLWTELLALAVGGALVAVSIKRASFAYIAFGVGTVFLGLIMLIVRRLDDPTQASLALMLLGALLIATVMVLAKVRPWNPAPA